MSPRIPLLVAVVAVPLAVSRPAPLCAQRPASPGVREVDVRRALDGDGLLRVWNLAGAVRVVGWDRDSVVVTGTVPVGRSFFCGGTAAAMKCAVDVPMKEEGHVRGGYLEVRLPRRARLWLKSGSADLTVSGFDGDLDAYSVSGAIRVDGHARVVQVESMGGELEILGSAGTLRARTAGGRITLRVDAPDAVASSVSGDVLALGSRFRQAHLETVDGDLKWEGDVAAGAALDFVSHAGTVQLVLPDDVSADFTIATYEGSVRNDFGSTRLVTARDLDGRELRFTLGAGGARIAIRTFKGRIALVRR